MRLIAPHHITLNTTHLIICTVVVRSIQIQYMKLLIKLIAHQYHQVSVFAIIHFDDWDWDYFNTSVVPLIWSSS